MVNKDRVRLLVEALRSGRFAQTRNQLITKSNGDKQYCCLGVACVVAIANGCEAEEVNYSHTHTLVRGSRDHNDESDNFLPAVVIDWYGFDEEDPILKTDLEVDGETTYQRATQLNDDLFWDFERIADAFEQKFLDDETTREDNDNE